MLLFVFVCIYVSVCLTISMQEFSKLKSRNLMDMTLASPMFVISSSPINFKGTESDRKILLAYLHSNKIFFPAGCGYGKRTFLNFLAVMNLLWIRTLCGISQQLEYKEVPATLTSFFDCLMLMARALTTYELLGRLPYLPYLPNTIGETTTGQFVERIHWIR